MDIKGIVIFLVLIAIIILYLKNIKEIIIPTKISKLEIITILISVIVIFVITYLYEKTWFHNIVGFLAAVLMIVTLPRRGITSKGFRSIKGIYWGNWNKLKSVHVTMNKDVKVYFTGRYLSYDTHYYNYDTHYYNKEDYNKVIKILQENVPSEILKID